jgi:hypothetical protein
MSGPSNTYHFVTRWRVPGTCGEVADILGDPMSLVRWWPSVYLSVDELAPPGPGGVGRRVRLHTRGWLPYTLRWEFEVVESSYPHGFALVAAGDLEGRGAWTIAQDGGMVDVTYDWTVAAEKPLLRRLSFVLKPVFEANHRWAMAQGEKSLRLELERRRATSDQARSAVPPPPGPMTYAAAAVLGLVAAASLGGAYLVVRAARQRGRR